MLDLSNATIASVSSVVPTCWQRALTGVSRPASGTDTGELVHFIHTCPTIQAWSGCTLIDVWVKSTERRVEQIICIMPNYIWASFNAYEERMWNIFVWDKVEYQPKTQSRDKGQYYILLYWRRQSLKKKHNRNCKKVQNLPHSDTHRNTLVLCTLLEEDWEHWLTTIQRGRRVPKRFAGRKRRRWRAREWAEGETVSAGRWSGGATKARKQAITSACSQLAAPHQALLTSPALRSHHFITGVTQEVDLMADTVWLTKLPPIGGCLKFWAGTFGEE